MTDLLPCPFCGGPARLRQVGDLWTAECAEDDECRGSSEIQPDGSNGYTQERFAVAAWNRRAQPQGVVALVAFGEFGVPTRVYPPGQTTVGYQTGEKVVPVYAAPVGVTEADLRAATDYIREHNESLREGETLLDTGEWPKSAAAERAEYEEVAALVKRLEAAVGIGD